MNVDITVVNNGNIFAFYAHSEQAREWIDENVESEGWQWLGGGLMVDHRYAAELARGMIDAGLELR